MKNLFLLALLSLAITLLGCDPQSGIAKKSVEKYTGTPTPTITPTPTEEPIDPADVVQVDTSLQGPTLSVSAGDKKSLVCNKFNRVMVNGSGQKVSITGACSQIMVNGNSNEVTAEAVMDIVLNGRYNIVHYSRFGNGKRPSVTGSVEGSTIEKIAAPRKK